ncbi:MAG: methyltransferase domain-containing protein, partial [Candidatus Omnitrophica bacterium]|nr:methyltransferase domain-containing protein [Candidatus Omnitrophota bacterium]
MMKVNLGCGPVGKDDWFNIDWGILAFLHASPLFLKVLMALRLLPPEYSIKWPGNLMLRDCRRKLPFEDSSVDYIYTSHFLEHLKRFEAEKVLKECHRVLKDEGILRIVVPDLGLILKKYTERDKQFFIDSFHRDDTKAAEGLALADLLSGVFYPEANKLQQSRLKKIASFFIRAHLWMYDSDSLTQLLKSSGFRTVEKNKFREGNVPDLDTLDV